MTSLPAGLKELYLNDNNFLGQTDFSKLPKAMGNLDVSNTQIKGEIHPQKRNDWFRVRNSAVEIVIAESQE